MSTKTDVFKNLINEIIEENPSINTLKSDVIELKSDVALLKSDVAELKSDMSTVKKDIVKLYEGQLYLGGMMEDMKHTLSLVLEAVRPGQGRATLVEEVAAKVEDHEYRISAVESVVKGHGP